MVNIWFFLNYKKPKIFNGTIENAGDNLLPFTHTVMNYMISILNNLLFLNNKKWDTY